MYNTIFTSGSNRNRVDKKTREQQNEKACNGYMPARSAGMFAYYLTPLFLLFFLHHSISYGQENQNIIWNGTGEVTLNRYYDMCGHSGNRATILAEECNSCTKSYTIIDNNSNGDNAGRLYFKAPTGCKLKITLNTYSFGYNHKSGCVDINNKDHLYIKESENATETNPQITTGYDRKWEYNDLDALTFTTNNPGKWVIVYFDNQANKKTKNCEQHSYSTFNLTIECVNCCTTPTLSGCPAGGELELGSTATLSVSAGATVSSWTITPTGIVSIAANGVVTPIATGSTTISAVVSNTGGFCGTTLTCPITVVEPPCTTPSFINCPATNMTSGDKLQLTWNTTATPSGWTSSNSSVASVSSSGEITAKAEGQATITAEVAANGDYCAGTMPCTVNVSCRNSGKTLSFTNSPLSATVNSGETFNTTVSNTSGRTVTYHSSNTSVATIDASGVVHAVSEGSATITASIASWTSNDTTYCAINSSNSIAITVPSFICSGSNTESIVGDGTSTSYYEGPIQTNTKYSYRQIIYTPSEVGCTSGEIKAIGFSYSGSYPMTNKTDVKIYMGETAKTEFNNNTDWIASGGLTLVYSGSLNCSAQDWKWFQLNTPYSYAGGNLVVAILDDSGEIESGNSYTFHVRNFTSLGYKQLRCYDAYSAINTSSLPSGYLGSTRPLTKFCIQCCDKITSTFALSAASGSVAAGGTTTVTLTNGTGQTVAWSSDNSGVATVSAATSGSSITATIAGVAEGTAHITATVTGWTSGGTTYCDTTVTYTVTVSDGCAKIGDGSTPSGSGNDGTYGGLFTYNRCQKSYTQQVYTAAELTAAGACAGGVTSIALHYATTTAYNFKFKVYMGQKASANLQYAWVEDADLVEVYSTNGLSLSNGWNTIPVSGFTWDGTSDIVVAIYRTDYVEDEASYYIYPDFYHTNTDYMCRFTHNYTMNFDHVDVNNLPQTSVGERPTDAGTDQRPEMKFCINCCNLGTEIEITD